MSIAKFQPARSVLDRRARSIIVRGLQGAIDPNQRIAALASDMRFASREKAILSQWEVGAGLSLSGTRISSRPARPSS